jgi:diguanylate cyclase (GGDEF)-like protein
MLRRSVAFKIAATVGFSCLALTLVVLAWVMLTGRLTEGFHLHAIGGTLLAIIVGVVTFLVVKIYLTTPLRKLTEVIVSAVQGNFLSRVKLGTRDELEHLGGDFNKLLAKLTDFQASKIDADLELDMAQRELKYKEQLEEQTHIIENTNKKLTRRLSELALLYEVNRMLTSTLDIDEILKMLTEKVGGAVQVDELTVLLIDEKKNKLRIAAILGDPRASWSVNQLVDPMTGLFSESLRKGNHFLIPDLSRVPLKGKDWDYLPDNGSFLSIPMNDKNRLMGLLNFVRNDKQAFSEHQIKLLTSVTRQAALAILNAQLYQEKLDLSVTDELTKLANRRKMQTRLELEWNRARRFNSDLSLLMIDIDHFKRYNDRNGHLLGDKVLQGVARILEGNTREVDTVARFGGEEFVVILPGQDQQTAKSVADKLRRAVYGYNFPRTQSQPGGHLSISVGVAAYPGDADDPKVLLDKSDLALYVAKRAGRDRTVSYEQELERVEADRQKALAAKKNRRRRHKRKPRMELAKPN